MTRSGEKTPPETIEKMKSSWTPARKAKQSKYFSKENNPFYNRTHTPETRKKISDKAKETARNRSPEQKAKISEKHKARWRDPEYHAMMVQKHKDRFTKELRAHQSDVQRKLCEDVGHIKKMSDKAKETWEDPEYRERLIQKHKDWWKDPIHTASKSGPNHWNWQGGTSFEPYCSKFDHYFKEYIRIKFSRTCYLCGTVESSRRHSVHHIDYNKKSICNGKEWAFILLCRKCHPKTNSNRWYWFSLFVSYWLVFDNDINFVNLVVF